MVKDVRFVVRIGAEGGKVTDGRTDERTLVIVESLSELKKQTAKPTWLWKIPIDIFFFLTAPNK